MGFKDAIIKGKIIEKNKEINDHKRRRCCN